MPEGAGTADTISAFVTPVMAAVVPIVVVGVWGEPDGAEAPTGDVSFDLSAAILSPEYVASKTVWASLSGGGIAQQLVANDYDATGAPLDPATTMYYVRERVLGAPGQEYSIVVPAVPPGSRSIFDGVTTEGEPTLASATANFTGNDLGAYLLVPGLPVGTQIASVTNSATVVMTQAASADATGLTVLIGASVDLATLRAA